MSAAEKLRILVIPDPTRLRTIEDVRGGNFPDWILMCLPATRAKTLLKTMDVKGLIHKARPSEYRESIRVGYMAVYINEILLLWLEIGETLPTRIEPVFMDFKTFRDILVSDDILHDLANEFSAVWGGLDLTSGSDSDQVKLTGQELDKYVKGIQNLEKVVTVWPSSQEMLQLRELDTITMLDEIARVETKTIRPWSSLLPPNSPDMPLVLKREERSCGKNTIVKTCDRNRIRSILRKKDRSPYRWYCQEWIPEWTEVGQWRCIIVGGQMINHILLNGPDGLTLREDGRTLAGMYQLQNARDIMFPEGGTIYDIRAADAELKDFVKLTLSKLIQMEEEKHGFQSSLRLWSRVDLSIIRDSKNKTYNYFVTGVERGLRMRLYGKVHPVGVRMFADGFAEQFHRYLSLKGVRN
ncbi:hypothetical protein JVU11DRAFT_9181 [Chiua virens]|nr:hypothetical protein JVU11DRAFT_9181 [Chiua virens]